MKEKKDTNNEIKKEEEQEEKSEGKDFQKEIEKLQKNLAEEKDAKLRALADAQNIKARAQKEKEELLLYSQLGLLAKILDVVDDFSHLIESKPLPDDDPWMKGVLMVYQKLQDLVHSEGVKQLEAKEGDVFNPLEQEAIGFVTVDSDDEDQKIAQIVTQGYKQTHNDKIIRPAKVIVKKK